VKCLIQLYSVISRIWRKQWHGWWNMGKYFMWKESYHETFWLWKTGSEYMFFENDCRRKIGCNFAKDGNNQQNEGVLRCW